MTALFDPERNHVLISVKIVGPVSETIARMALDTGATRTLLDRGIATDLGFEITLASETVRIVTGSRYEIVPIINVERIEALGHYRENLPILCKSLPAGLTIDGLLDLDFFRGQRLIIDFREGLVTLD